jgi:Ca2+:H+ antiporter
MNFALSHVLGSTIQTALLVAPIVTIVSWGIGRGMDLNFEIFMVVLLILSILVVGNFLRDGKSNYLEGALCILVYAIIAVTTWYYPNASEGGTNTVDTTGETGEGAATSSALAIATELAVRALSG